MMIKRGGKDICWTCGNAKQVVVADGKGNFVVKGCPKCVK
jgi:hypothetical protein